jgi:small subunit ribosomal protein S11
MLALRRSAATRHPFFVSYLRSTSTESSNPWITDGFPLHTIAAATRHQSSASTETPKEIWVDDAFSAKLKDNPPTGRAFARMSFPGTAKLDIPKYRLHCKSNNNNTIITFTNNDGKTIAWQSGGKCAFKGANRASYEAGYQSAVRIFKVIENLAEEKDFSVALFFKGFGQGRDAVKTALLAVEGLYIRPLICSVTDRTPIKIGGTRSKKTRRL